MPLDARWVAENGGGAGARIGDVAGRGSWECVSFVRMWRGRRILEGTVVAWVDSRWALMFLDGRGWAGSFAVREILDRFVYDGGPLCQ